MSFFRKGLHSLEAAESHVRMVTKQQHIDYQLSGLECDGDNHQEATEAGEYKQGQDVATSRKSTEVGIQCNSNMSEVHYVIAETIILVFCCTYPYYF